HRIVEIILHLFDKIIPCRFPYNKIDLILIVGFRNHMEKTRCFRTFGIQTKTPAETIDKAGKSLKIYSETILQKDDHICNFFVKSLFFKKSICRNYIDYGRIC